MARISGSDTSNKRNLKGLTAIYGIGRTTAQQISASIPQGKSQPQLSTADISEIQAYIEASKTDPAEEKRRADTIQVLKAKGLYRGVADRSAKK